MNRYQRLSKGSKDLVAARLLIRGVYCDRIGVSSSDRVPDSRSRLPRGVSAPFVHGIGSVHHELEIEWQLREFQGLHACIRNTDIMNLSGYGSEGIKVKRICLVMGCPSFPGDSKRSPPLSLNSPFLCNSGLFLSFPTAYEKAHGSDPNTRKIRVGRLPFRVATNRMDPDFDSDARDGLIRQSDQPFPFLGDRMFDLPRFAKIYIQTPHGEMREEDVVSAAMVLRQHRQISNRCGQGVGVNKYYGESQAASCASHTPSKSSSKV